MLPALPVPAEEPEALRPSTPGVLLVPPSLADTKVIIALGTDQCLTFILFASHSMCVGVQQVYQMCSKIESNV